MVDSDDGGTGGGKRGEEEGEEEDEREGKSYVVYQEENCADLSEVT